MGRPALSNAKVVLLVSDSILPIFIEDPVAL